MLQEVLGSSARSDPHRGRAAEPDARQGAKKLEPEELRKIIELTIGERP
jgi:hypothetical protein